MQYKTYYILMLQIPHNQTKEVPEKFLFRWISTHILEQESTKLPLKVWKKRYSLFAFLVKFEDFLFVFVYVSIWYRYVFMFHNYLHSCGSKRFEMAQDAGFQAICWNQFDWSTSLRQKKKANYKNQESELVSKIQWNIQFVSTHFKQLQDRSG